MFWFDYFCCCWDMLCALFKKSECYYSGYVSQYFENDLGGGEDCAYVFYLLKMSEGLQFSDKLPYFTTDVTLEFENSPVWPTFRFELRIFTQRVCSLADRKCLCVCGGGGWKGIKQILFFIFSHLIHYRMEYPRGLILKGSLQISPYNGNLSMVILFLFS